MFDLFAIALFQLATLFGSPAGQTTANDSTPATDTVGSGGWGHDLQATPPPPPTQNNLDTVGSGGWGHD